MGLTVPVTYADVFEFAEDYRANLRNLSKLVDVPSPVAVGDDVTVKLRVPVFDEEIALQGRVMAPMGTRAGLQLESGDRGLVLLEQRYRTLGRLVEHMLVSGRFKVAGQWAEGAAPATGEAAPRAAAPAADPGLVDPYTLGPAERSGELSLERTSDLLMALHSNHETGVIEFRVGTQRRLAYLKGGGIVQYVGDPVVEQHCLGVLLARAGRITPEQLQESLDTMNRTGQKQGEVFVEMGLLSFPQLVMSLMTQVDIITRGLLGETQGTFQYWALPSLPSTIITPPMKTPAFLFGYYKKMYAAMNRSDIAVQLEPYMEKYCALHTGIDWDEMRLKSVERGLIDILGSRSWRFREVFSVSNTNRGLTEQVLMTLLGMGLISMVDEEDVGQVHDRWTAALEKKHVTMRTQNPFELLETHWTSRTAQVEKAYARMKSEYQGFGRGAALPPHAEELRGLILDKVEEAYAQLKTTGIRQETRKKYYEPMQHEFSADLLFKQGEMLMVRELWAEALDNFERAVELKPEEGKYRKYRDMAAGRGAARS
jgi:hypothetical protein